MTFDEYIESRMWVCDHIICRGADYEEQHPEIFGVMCSPQGDSRESWGKWWLWRAFDRIVREAH